LPGDPEKAGTFLAHSFVFLAAEVLKTLEGMAPRRGETVVEAIGTADDGLTSGD
jgi:hypothetical protein